MKNKKFLSVETVLPETELAIKANADFFLTQAKSLFQVSIIGIPAGLLTTLLSLDNPFTVLVLLGVLVTLMFLYFLMKITELSKNRAIEEYNKIADSTPEDKS